MESTSQDQDTTIAERVIDIVSDTCSPEQVFDQSELEEWALSNGFVKEVEAESGDAAASEG